MFAYPYEDEHSTLANAILAVGHLNHWKLGRTLAMVQEFHHLERKRIIEISSSLAIERSSLYQLGKNLHKELKNEPLSAEPSIKAFGEGKSFTGPPNV